MTINGIYYPHVLSLPGVPGIGEVARFDSLVSDPQYDMIQRMAGGDPYPCFVGAASANPQITFTSPSIKPVLQACTDQEIVRDLQSGDVELTFRRGKPQSMRENLEDSVHFKAVLNNSGMLYWDQITARESEDVTISAVILAARSGVALNPWLNVGEEALIAPNCDSIYTLGPVIFNGRHLASIHQINWSNNVETYSRKTAMNPRDPCWQSIKSFRPVITAATNDLQEFTHESPEGATTNALDTYGGQQMSKLQVFLRRRRRTGFYYEDNLPEHIEVRCFGGWKAGGQISGLDPSEGELQFHCSQAVSGTSGRVASDFLLTKLIDVAIPNVDPTAAPDITQPANQNVADNSDVFFAAELGTGGIPTSWSVDQLPSGLTINATSGLISGTVSGTGTTPVQLTATNANGSSIKNFDFIVT